MYLYYWNYVDWPSLHTTLHPYYPAIAVFGGAILACAVYDLLRLSKGKMMVSDTLKKRWLREYSAWLITEAFEEAYFKNKITREQRDYMYQFIGSRCNMMGLLPKGPNTNFPDQLDLVEAIKKRIKGTVSTPKKIESILKIKPRKKAV